MFIHKDRQTYKEDRHTVIKKTNMHKNVCILKEDKHTYSQKDKKIYVYTQYKYILSIMYTNICMYVYSLY